MSEGEQWVAARVALERFGGVPEGRRAIKDRAGFGLLRSRSRRMVMDVDSGPQVFESEPVADHIWRRASFPEVEAAAWATGDFAFRMQAALGSPFRILLFGVEFAAADMPGASRSTPLRMKVSGLADFFEDRGAQFKARAKPTIQQCWKAAREAFPNHHISRETVEKARQKYQPSWSTRGRVPGN